MNRIWLVGLLIWLGGLAGCAPTTGDDDGVIGTGLKPDALKIVGTAQKGPYLTNSEVLLNELYADGTPSSRTVVTYIDNDLGEFRFSVTQPGPVLITADGYHFNELTDTISDGRLLLKAVYNVSSLAEQQIYVSPLTHIIHKRILNLMTTGMAVDQARRTAETEALTALSAILPIPDIENFTQFSLYSTEGVDRPTGSGYMVALSATIYQYAYDQMTASGKTSLDAQLARSMSQLADALGAGEVLSDDLLNGLAQASRRVRPDVVTDNLTRYRQSHSGDALPVGNMDWFIDTDGDGVVNALDDDDDNDGMPDDEDDSPYVYSEAPVVIVPDLAESQPANREFELAWQASEYALAFQLQVYRLNDPDNFLVDVTQENTSYLLNLDAGLYGVKLRSRNRYDGWGQWSDEQVLTAGLFTRLISFTDSADVAQHVSEAADGGFYVGGNTRSERFSTDAVFVLRLDELGRQLWRKELDTVEDDHLDVAYGTRDGGVLVQTSYTPVDDAAATLYKLNAHGDLEWTTRINQHCGGNRAILEQADGYVIPGRSCTFVVVTDPVTGEQQTEVRHMNQLTHVSKAGLLGMTYNVITSMFAQATMDFIRDTGAGYQFGGSVQRRDSLIASLVTKSYDGQSRTISFFSAQEIPGMGDIHTAMGAFDMGIYLSDYHPDYGAKIRKLDSSGNLVWQSAVAFNDYFHNGRNLAEGSGSIAYAGNQMIPGPDNSYATSDTLNLFLVNLAGSEQRAYRMRVADESPWVQDIISTRGDTYTLLANAGRLNVPGTIAEAIDATQNKIVIMKTNLSGEQANVPEQ